MNIAKKKKRFCFSLFLLFITVSVGSLFNTVVINQKIRSATANPSGSTRIFARLHLTKIYYRFDKDPGLKNKGEMYVTWSILTVDESVYLNGRIPTTGIRKVKQRTTYYWKTTYCNWIQDANMEVIYWIQAMEQDSGPDDTFSPVWRRLTPSGLSPMRWYNFFYRSRGCTYYYAFYYVLIH